MPNNEYVIKDNILVRCIVNEPRVVIPSNVTEIANHCFCIGDTEMGQANLVQVIIPENVTKIGEGAFMRSPNLKSVIIRGKAEIGMLAFYDCPMLYDFIICDGVKSLGRNCIGECRLLDHVFIPASVEHIDSWLCLQEEPEIEQPIFFCERYEPAPGWAPDWNHYYEHRDPEMGYSQEYRHKVFYGLTRIGFLRESYESVRPPKPTTATTIPENDEERYTLALNYIAKGRWSDAFDLVYEPSLPYQKKQRDLICRFLNGRGINMLRNDQIEMVAEEARWGDAPTAALIWGYWSMWNAIDMTGLDIAETYLLDAAKGGYGDAWETLKHMYLSGQNKRGIIDSKKAQYYLEEALISNSLVAFSQSVVKPLLYGWDGTEINVQKAYDLVKQRMASPDAETDNPMLINLLGSCYLEMGNKEEAIKCARKALELENSHYQAYILLFHCLCIDSEGNYLEGGQEREEQLVEEAVANNCPWGLFTKAIRLDNLSEKAEDEDKSALEHEARLLYEKAALLGDPDACYNLALNANSGTLGFYGPRTIDAYPFFMRGTMAGSCDCSYWISQMALIALDDNYSPAEREFNFGSDMTHDDPQTWYNLAWSYHKYYDVPWPNEEDTDVQGQPASDSAKSYYTGVNIDKQWNVCNLQIDWEADRNNDGDRKQFARKDGERASELPVAESGMTLSFDGMYGCGTWGALFNSVKVIDSDQQSLTISYGSMTYRLLPGHTVVLGRDGRDYTSFELSIRIE